MRTVNIASCVLAVCLPMALIACGGGDADPAAAGITSPVFGTDGQGASYIGADRCLGCHETLTPGVAARYLASRHAQPGTVDASAPPECLACHDPLGDGWTLGAWFSGTVMPAGGMTAVGCENCHGAGSHHLAMIPEHPNPAPDYTACGQCHAALPAGPEGHADGRADNNIVGKHLASAHARSLVLTSIPLCARCHSDEGFRRLAPQTVGLDGGELQAALNGVARVANPSLVQCRTCHESHSGALRAGATLGEEEGGAVTKYSRQFNLCTSCHQVFLTTTFNLATGAYDYLLDTGRIPYHGFLDNSGRPLPGDQVIWDTHFPTGDGGIIGYNINAAAANACTQCHALHTWFL